MSKLMKLKRDKKGFTLMEIIIVIAIIAILAAILIPSMIGWVQKSKKSAFKTEANGIKTAVELELTNKIANGDDNNLNSADFPVGDEFWTTLENKTMKGIKDRVTWTYGKDRINKFTYDDGVYQITYEANDNGDFEWGEITDSSKE